MDDEMGIDDIRDVQVTLYELRGLVAQLHAGIAFGEVDALTLTRLRAMQACPGLTTGSNSSLELSTDFRAVLDSVRGSRDVLEMTSNDFGKVADQFRQWLPFPLSGGWRSLIYDMRSEHSRK